MLETQTECSCDYYNVYSVHFFQSLGQLTAGLLSTAVLVPMYTYYSKYFLVNNDINTNYTNYTNNTEYEEVENDTENDTEDDTEDDTENKNNVIENDLRVENNFRVETNTLNDLDYLNINLKL